MGESPMAFFLSTNRWSATVKGNGRAAKAQKEQELQVKKHIPLPLSIHCFLTKLSKMRYLLYRKVEQLSIGNC